MSGLNTERILMGALSLGISRGAFECALKYAKERVQFGKPIAAFQLIQGKLADMAMEIELSRLITYKGAAMADQGLKRELNLIAAYAKLFTSEVAMRITIGGCTDPRRLRIHEGISRGADDARCEIADHRRRDVRDSAAYHSARDIECKIDGRAMAKILAFRRPEENCANCWYHSPRRTDDKDQAVSSCRALPAS